MKPDVYTAGKYINCVIKVGWGIRDAHITLFNYNDLKRFKPENRLAFLKAYYQWRQREWSVFGSRTKMVEKISHHFYHPNKVYLSLKQVEELLFSITFSEDHNGNEAVEFIKEYKLLLDKLRKTAKQHIKMKKKIVAAGMWK